MPIRKNTFETGNIYHVYNRGVDKKVIFPSKKYFQYFLDLCYYCNQRDALGGMKEYRYVKNKIQQMRLVEVYAYCINQNHFHFILKQVCENGIQNFMQRLGTGYTMYFNKQKKRTGVLFQGRFKSSAILEDTYMRHVFVYVNQNNEVHKIFNKDAYIRSFEEYSGDRGRYLCTTDVMNEWYGNVNTYITEAQEVLEIIQVSKEKQKEIEFSSNT